jgi:mono/diheme cytochrome c family protein
VTVFPVKVQKDRVKPFPLARWKPLLAQLRTPTALAAIGVSLLLLLLPALFHLDGKQHANWQQFLGRFHPLAVHLPIGFLVLLPLLEIAGRRRLALREAAGFVLKLAFLSSVGALTLGYLLAYGSGAQGATVVHHMWGGIALTIGVLLCLLARREWIAADASRIYPALLTVVLLLLVYTAHQGGSLTYGGNYLTQYLPAPLQRFAMSGQAKENADSFYTKHIHPVFDANCVSCHGESKVQGGLRLDSYAELMKGGKDGAVIVAGKPTESLLLQRITLPTDNKLFMPAEGHPPLSAEEIGWIRTWIAQGASPVATSMPGITFAETPKDPPITPVGDYTSLMEQIHQMQNAQGAKLAAVSSKPSDGLVLHTIDVASGFDDAQLTQFEKFAPYIVEVELGHTAVSDACFDTLAKFRNLRAIHLEGTAVTGAGILKLVALPHLVYLNLSNTKLTKEAAAQLATMKNLRHVYLFDTPAQPPAPVPVIAEPKPATGDKKE